MTSEYYTDVLSARRLERVYELAPSRVKRYLEAEVEHLLEKVGSRDAVLELGCGYGRILPRLSLKAKRVFGIDTSFESLEYGRARLARFANCHLAQMNAVRLGFRSGAFDGTICIQNGISAFHVDFIELMKESIRVTKRGGWVVFSSYSGDFWQHRLDWFERQAEAGLVGEIDYEKTRDGSIVCKDGFTATTLGAPQFEALARELAVSARVVEVDASSIFCEIEVGESSTGGARSGG